jgi:hypothetical protein
MTERMMPKYPIYIPSKGRWDKNATAKTLVEDGVPFKLVVEPQEFEAYAEAWGEDHILTLPWNDPGSVIPARNWIKDHSTANGDKRHWQLDDNIRYMHRWYRGKRIRCRAGIALRITEDFVDRYTNVALAGLEYLKFAISARVPPITLNTRIYSCTLVLNEIPYRWRGRYNEDTDICLRALADGWCTVLMNAFLCDKLPTMTVKGGNTQVLYQGDGRLKMAKELERRWPGVVTTERRFHRPQHVVKDSWRRFDNQLIRRDDIDWEALEAGGVNEFGLTMEMKEDEIKSKRMKDLYEERKALERGDVQLSDE